MKKYLLDTNILAAYLIGRSNIVFLIEPIILQDEAATSIIVYGELDEYHRSMPDYQQRRQVLRALLRRVTPYVPTYAIMEGYATIRRALRPPYGPGIIGDMDTLIAATAMYHRLTVVSADSDFTRVQGLALMSIERSWLKLP